MQSVALQQPVNSCAVQKTAMDLPAKWQSWLSTRHKSWFTAFGSRTGHTENLGNGTSGLSGIVLGVNGWMQAIGSCAVLLLTRYQCNALTVAVSCESAQRRKQVKVGAADHSWHTERSTESAHKRNWTVYPRLTHSCVPAWNGKWLVLLKIFRIIALRAFPV